jgi:uncharacterized protein
VSNHYLDAVRQGKNHWWRYILGIISILFIGFIVGSLAIFGFALVALALSGTNLTNLFNDSGSGEEFVRALEALPIVNFVAVNLQFVFLMLGMIFAMKLIHQRRFRTLISNDGSFKWSRFFVGFEVWTIGLAITVGIAYLTSPQDFTWTFSWDSWLPLLAVVLIFTPIQTAAEELLCRGYLTQGLGLLTRNRLLLIALPNVLFAIAHFSNPEMSRGPVFSALYYWAFGAFAALLTLRDNRLELAMGIHTANNMIGFLFINTKDSVIKTPSVFTLPGGGDSKHDLMLFLVQASITYWVLFGRHRRPMIDNPVIANSTATNEGAPRE